MHIEFQMLDDILGIGKKQDRGSRFVIKPRILLPLFTRNVARGTLNEDSFHGEIQIGQN